MQLSREAPNKQASKDYLGRKHLIRGQVDIDGEGFGEAQAACLASSSSRDHGGSM